MADKSDTTKDKQEKEQILDLQDSKFLWLPHWGRTNKLFESSMLRRKTIKFRDGSKLTVFEENQMIAEYLIMLERDAAENPLSDVMRQLFRQMYYSKLLACSIGDIPSEDQTRVMPAEELENWVAAVREINPRWFENMDKALAQMTEEEKKRKPRKRRR